MKTARAKVVVVVAVAAVMEWVTISPAPKTTSVAVKAVGGVEAAEEMVLSPNVRIAATATTTMIVVATGTAMRIVDAIVTAMTADGTATVNAAVIGAKQSST
jgi:hypothetical protein